MKIQKLEKRKEIEEEKLKNGNGNWKSREVTVGQRDWRGRNKKGKNKNGEKTERERDAIGKDLELWI